ncbi:MAG: amidohydrolase family protein [Ginsengibacter sp.]
MRIDSHQHFWNYNRKNFTWIDDSMQVIRKDFTPPMLKIILDENNIDGCVAIQTAQTEEETNFLLAYAAEYDFIKGVVGWVDLQSDDVEQRLIYYKQFPLLKGLRHIVQGEDDPVFLQRPAFKNGISLLQKMNYTYDILIYPHQLKMAIDFVADFPEQKFVLDHLAKPYIKTKMIEEWKKDLLKLAAFENVSCKISGLVNETDWKNYTPQDIFPYIETALEAFGINRVMFGSDWPVCLVAADYTMVLNIVEEVFKSFSIEEQDNFFGNNATKFYNLNTK